VHMVSAWANTKSGTAQRKVADMSNEITAIPKLLQVLELSGTVSQSMPLDVKVPLLGRPWKDTRVVLNGVLWILRTGAQWQDLPKRHPPYQTWSPTSTLAAERSLDRDFDYCCRIWSKAKSIWKNVQSALPSAKRKRDFSIGTTSAAKGARSWQCRRP